MSKQARGIRVIRVICVDKTDRRGKRKEGRWRYRETEREIGPVGFTQREEP